MAIMHVQDYLNTTPITTTTPMPSTKPLANLKPAPIAPIKTSTVFPDLIKETSANPSISNPPITKYVSQDSSTFDYVKDNLTKNIVDPIKNVGETIKTKALEPIKNPLDVLKPKVEKVVKNVKDKVNEIVNKADGVTKNLTGTFVYVAIAVVAVMLISNNKSGRS